MGEYKLLLEHAHDDAYGTLDGYKKTGGYAALAKALKGDRQAVIDQVKASGLRGRGGAGFPAGMKWEFTRAAPGQRKWVLC
ncbi:MAG: hypothetical protein M9893_10310, partial [Pyrinomonadaceae bacterium]|nr:hypothetical protein [Pyrinomonadaceae bacterium]